MRQVFPCSTPGFGLSVFARPSRLSQQLVPLLAPEMRVLLAEAWLPDGELRHERGPVGIRRPRCAAQMRTEDAIGFMAKAQGCFIGPEMPFGNENSIAFKAQSCLTPMRLRIALMPIGRNFGSNPAAMSQRVRTPDQSASGDVLQAMGKTR